jgi:hypothetical protein
LIGLLVAYDGLIEGLPLQAQGRSAEWGDVLAFAIGIAIGALGAALMLRVAAAPEPEFP